MDGERARADHIVLLKRKRFVSSEMFEGETFYIERFALYWIVTIKFFFHRIISRAE